MKTIELRRSIRDEIILHAQKDSPRECCGLLAGTVIGSRSIANSRYPLVNDAANPEREYFASPEGLFKAMRSMRVAMQEMIAIYHSHPKGEAKPSHTDLELASYKTVYLIVGLAATPEIRAFEFENGNATEVTIIVN